MNNNTKICSKCKEKKSLKEFYKHNTTKDKLRPECKTCYQKYSKKYWKKYYKKNRSKIIKQKRKYNLNNKNKIKEYYFKNEGKIKEQGKKYRKQNKEKLRIYRNKRLKNNFNEKLGNVLRSRIRMALKNKCKSNSTMKLIGCSIEQLKQHLESQFVKGMNWNNHSFYGWHIDHIRPCYSFNLSKPKEQYKCFHYTNLQPLWAKDNYKKRYDDKKIYKKGVLK